MYFEQMYVIVNIFARRIRHAHHNESTLSGAPFLINYTYQCLSVYLLSRVDARVLDINPYNEKI